MGTGLMCRLGEDLRADPSSIAICDCALKKLASLAVRFSPGARLTDGR
jgi:hypothetical protein